MAEMLQIGGGDTDNDSQIEPDNELEPAQLMAGPASASSLAKTVNVNLGDLLANFRDGKPKVQLKTEAIKISGRSLLSFTELNSSRLVYILSVNLLKQHLSLLIIFYLY